MSQDQGSVPNPEAARPAELTAAAVILGVILSVVMGAANVYLGLRAGMTVSASIPAAVIAMGVLRIILRRTSVLESNMVQTAASAGESLAAGIIFTMPALLLTGVWQTFDFWTTTLVALSGGLLGILLMIPMRQVFVVDRQELKFPEGVACAEVLRAGETEEGAPEDHSGLRLIIGGILVGSVFKFVQSFLGMFRGAAEGAFLSAGRVYYLGADISPALFSVGYIVTLPIAAQIFAGGAIGWIIALPLLGTAGVPTESAVDTAYEIWSTKVRYIGVGAMVVGGISSIWSVRGGLVSAVKQLFDIVLRRSDASLGDPSTRNLSGGVILGLGLLCVVIIGGMYFNLLQGAVGLTLLTTFVMLVMSFFFAAVASYIVGLVGNSNSPVSGMTITAVLGTGALVYLFGFGGMAGIIATLGVAGVVCCVACTSGDVCNDLKTGYLVGASPRSQQIMQVLGVVVAAFVMAPIMTVLHEGSLKAGTGGIGGEEMSAPQAALIAALVEGFFAEGNLPKDMVAIGVGIGVLLLLADLVLARLNSPFRLHVMPVAVGMYLPFKLSAPILLGGLVRSFVRRKEAPNSETFTQRGVLLASGAIAGESLLGVLLGILRYADIVGFPGGEYLGEMLGFSAGGQDILLQIVSLAALLGIAFWVYRAATQDRR